MLNNMLKVGISKIIVCTNVKMLFTLLSSDNLELIPL